MYLFIIFTNPSARAGYDTRSLFKLSLTGLNSEYSFSYTSCLTKAEEPTLSYYLTIAGGRIIGFIPFPRVLVYLFMDVLYIKNQNISTSYDKLSEIILKQIEGMQHMPLNWACFQLENCEEQDISSCTRKILHKWRQPSFCSGDDRLVSWKWS